MWESKDVILAAIISILTLSFRDGGPLIFKWLSWTSADRKVRAELESQGYEAVIIRLDRQATESKNKISDLETELDLVREEKHECEKKQGILELELKYVRERLDLVEKLKP